MEIAQVTKTKKAAPTVARPGGESQSAQTSQTQTAPVVAITPANLPSPVRATVIDQPPRQEPRLAVPPEVRRVTIKNGNFTFLDHAGRLLASFNGVDFRTSIRSALGASRQYEGGEDFVAEPFLSGRTALPAALRTGCAGAFQDFRARR